MNKYTIKAKLYGKTIYLIISPFIAWGVISWLLWWFRTHIIPFGKQIADAGNDSYGAYILHPIIVYMDKTGVDHSEKNSLEPVAMTSSTPH